MGRMLVVAALGLAGVMGLASGADACGWCGTQVPAGEQVTVRGKLLRVRHLMPTLPDDSRDILRRRWSYELEVDGKRYAFELVGDKLLDVSAAEHVSKMVVVNGHLRGGTIFARSIAADDTKSYAGKLDMQESWVQDTAYPPRNPPSRMVTWRLIGAKETHRVLFGSKAVQAQAEKLAGSSVLVRAQLTRSGLVVLSIEAVAIALK